VNSDGSPFITGTVMQHRQKSDNRPLILAGCPALKPDTILTDKRELAAWLESGCKPESEWRIGTEHEKFGFCVETLKPLPYAGERSIRAMLEGLAEQLRLGDRYSKTVCRSRSRRPAARSRSNPAGSWNCPAHCSTTCTRPATRSMPTWPRCAPWPNRWASAFSAWAFIRPPARRHRLDAQGALRDHAQLHAEGRAHGHDMMKRTCTVQVNLDFASEADMVAKFRASLALQPIATALFADSPFVEGRPAAISAIAARPGPIPIPTAPACCRGYSNRAWASSAMSTGCSTFRCTSSSVATAAMIDCAGQSFRDFLAGRLPALPGEQPTLADWEDHLTTAFPEVRLKRFLEMRGADGGPWRRLCALPAFWVGLLYDADNLAACLELTRDWSTEERQRLRDDVARIGLKAEIHGRSVLEIARELLDLARNGLARRQRLDGSGDHEGGFLNSLHKVVDRGTTPAEVKLDAFEQRWDGDLTRLFREYAY
jgi:glutamate--cysteine ligase